jgi:hypothetical protein
LLSGGFAKLLIVDVPIKFSASEQFGCLNNLATIHLTNYLGLSYDGIAQNGFC